MRITDSKSGYGAVTWAMHWLMFLGISTLFGLGLWMVDLDYYSPYYTLAPDIHRSLGMLLLFALVFRFAWRALNPRPAATELGSWERVAAHLVHWGFYPLMIALFVSGYLISTADGKPISVFGWFDVPATLSGPGQESTAGYVHMILAWATMALVAAHALAAFKHHFWDKSAVLARMWSGPFAKNSE